MVNLKKYDNTPISGLLQLSDLQSGDGWIKFPDGLFIQFGEGTVLPTIQTHTLMFKYIFSSIPTVLVTARNHYETKAFITIGQPGTDRVNVYISDFESGLKNERKFTYIAIGRWK